MMSKKPRRCPVDCGSRTARVYPLPSNILNLDFATQLSAASLRLRNEYQDFFDRHQRFHFVIVLPGSKETKRILGDCYRKQNSYIDRSLSCKSTNMYLKYQTWSALVSLPRFGITRRSASHSHIARRRAKYYLRAPVLGHLLHCPRVLQTL